uniref:Uncharacterized protein n=1 Tax=Aegilops tauschii subsp. strangulata TaxID=200361 RepID=A0A453IL11_AEGTS
MYSPPCSAAGSNGGQSFAAGANPLALLDHAMDFDEHVLFPMHNAGMQDGVQFYNPTAGGTELSRNMSMEKGLKGGKRKGSGEGSSTMHSQVMELQILSFPVLSSFIILGCISSFTYHTAGGNRCHVSERSQHGARWREGRRCC